jgi:regulatory protein
VTPEARLADPQARLQHALDAAYRYLGRRDRTVAEIRRHLESKRVEPDTIEGAVAELTEQGYLDDARYAVRFAEDRRTLDAWGPDRIERKLLQVGVDAACVAAALRAEGDDDDLALALGLLQRRFREPPSSDRERERALGVLVRKGYPLELAYDAVRAFERAA